MMARIIKSIGLVMVIAGSAQAEPLRIFYFDYAAYGPFFLAQQHDLYAREGLQVELVPVADTHAAYASLFTGHVDAIAAVVQDIPYFATPDAELKCVLALAEPVGIDGIVAHETIRTVADLQGRTVAYEDGSSTHFYLNVALRQAGLSQSDVEAVEIPDSDAVTAFRLGEVDAISTFGGMLLEAAQSPGAHVLIDSSQQPGIIVDCLITTEARLQEREPDFEALARAWDAAIAEVEASPDEAIATMAAALGGAHEDPELFAATLEKIRFYGRERNLDYFGTPEQPGPVYETAQVAIDVWQSAGALGVELTPADMISHAVWD